MAKFFRNNFDQDRWRKAALKNAFALLGRQRFIHAAAFFLLAGSLKDAVEVSNFCYHFEQESLFSIFSIYRIQCIIYIPF